MSHRTELQGFLSVKIPPKMRGFLPWKTWKRQWISVRCLPSGGADLVLGRSSQNVLRVSASDIIVRTHSRTHMYAFGIYPRDGLMANFCLAGTSESDSQKWISTLRKLVRPPLMPVEEGEFMVSVIDNVFTRSSGFPGLYGILRVNNAGITIIDPFTSKVVARWFWRQISHLYVASTLNKEDSGRICTIITSRDFPTGIGKIRLFCDEALDLIRNLTRGRCSNFGKFHVPRNGPYRHHTFSYNTKGDDASARSWAQPKRRPDSAKLGRRLSKSEGNLLSLLDHLETSSECSDSGFAHDFYNNLFFARFTEQDGRVTSEPNGSLTVHKTGFDVLLSRQAIATDSSESKPVDSIHVYQELSDHTENENRSPATGTRDTRTYCIRRQSGVSVASGVYEEIDELSISFTCGLNTVEEDPTDAPPPLPPRRNSLHRRLNGGGSSYQKMSKLELPDFAIKYISKSAGNTPLPSPPSLSRTTSSAEFFPAPCHGEEEAHYLPMNSRNLLTGIRPPSKYPEEEQHYVVMSSFIKDHT